MNLDDSQVNQPTPFRISGIYYLPIYWSSNHVDIDYIGLLIDRKLVSVKKCKMTVVDSRLLFFPCCNESSIDLDFNKHKVNITTVLDIFTCNIP